MPKQYNQPEENIDDISLLEPTATYSYADYLRWTFEERVEIIKGKFFNMSPAPVRIHQEVSVRLLTLFSNYLQGKKCKVYHAPFDVRLPGKPDDPYDKVRSVVQPDISIICNEKILDDNGCNGAPDLIVEIISPSTENRDLNQKYHLYQENKVKEYWIAYPKEELLDVFLLDQDSNQYMPAERYGINDDVPIRLFDGYSLRCIDIFR